MLGKHGLEEGLYCIYDEDVVALSDRSGGSI
jgi:hypothetical protein